MQKRSFFSARTLAQLGVLIAIMLVLNMTPLGFIPLGPINATTMHIPVLVGAIIGGWQYGLVLGLAFGLLSFFKAVQGTAGVLSFLFVNPIISIGARVAFGVIAGLIAKALLKQKPVIAYSVPAFVGSILNTILVMGLIWLIYAQQYGQAMGLAPTGVNAAILGVMFFNGVPESIVAAILSYAVCKALDLVKPGTWRESYMLKN